TDRFLPDKAVDLIDEAASRLKIELDSMPTEIDQLDRELMQLEMERQALKKEKDAASKERLAKLEKQIADIKERADKMKAQWQAEKSAIEQSRQLQVKLDALKLEQEQAQRRGDLARASEIQYGLIPKLNQEIGSANAKLGTSKGGPMLKEEVTEDDVAQVVAAWTHIPVSRLQEGEREKLVKMEERIGRRVVGQRTAISAVANAVRRSRSGLQDEARPIGSFLFLGPTGVGKTELSRALAEFLFDD